MTALHYVTASEHSTSVALLLEAGTDVNLLHARAEPYFLNSLRLAAIIEYQSIVIRHIEKRTDIIAGNNR